MYISIIGSPGSGKTTLFRALSGMADAMRPNAELIAAIDVPDERIDILSGIFNPRKRTYSRITISDTVSMKEGDIQNEKLSAKTIQNMRQSDAFLLVLKNFEDRSLLEVKDECMTILQEFIFSDMVQVENRLERIRKQAGKKENPELVQEEASLTECLAHLESGKPLITLPIFQNNGRHLRSFQFLSLKPMLIVMNCSEDNLARAQEAVESFLSVLPVHTRSIAACAKLEAELALMSPVEQGVFMAEYGIKESVRGRIIAMAKELLGLISFLTVGEDECRAWPLRNGLTAQEAAGTIHSDLAQRFIRAETVSYEDFICHGGFAECKKRGLWRLEGKTYIVRDGDILSIRAGN